MTNPSNQELTPMKTTTPPEPVDARGLRVALESARQKLLYIFEVTDDTHCGNEARLKANEIERTLSTANAPTDALTEDDIAEMLAKECAPYGKRKGATGLSAWCIAKGVNKAHANEFVNRKRPPTSDLLKALGIERVYQRTRCTVPPEGWWCSRAPDHEGPCAAHPIPNEGETIREAYERHFPTDALDMCKHGADRGSYCGYCGGYSKGQEGEAK